MHTTNQEDVMSAAHALATTTKRSGIPKSRKNLRAVPRPITTTTLGDLIAAAFDVASRVQDVAAIVSSPFMARAIQRRVVIL